MPSFPQLLFFPAVTLTASALAAVAYAGLITKPPSFWRSLAKVAATALLAVFAHMQGAPALLVVALLLSAGGDAFLSREGEPAFLGGLGSFLLAHIAFVILFALAGSPALFSAEIWRLAAAVALTMMGVGFLIILRRSVAEQLRIPVTVYCAAILAMGIAALGTTMPLVIVGATLFIASDMLLAWERFLASSDSKLRVSARLGVWVLYYAAQVLITLGFAL